MIDRDLILQIAGLGCASGLTAILVFNLDDYMDRSLLAKEARTAVATLVERGNDVRIRSATLPVYRQADSGDALFDRDYVFTGDSSLAAVLFQDGSTLNLTERSLVVIEAPQDDSDRSEFELVSGAFQASGNLNVKVGAGGQRLAIVDGSVEIEQSEAGASVVKLLAGKAQLKSGDKTVGLKENQFSTVSSDGAVSAPSAMPVTLIAPKGGETFARDDANPMMFVWQAERSFPGYKVEFSHRRDFLSAAFTLLSEAKRIKIPAEQFPVGQIYWRVIPRDDGGDVVTPSALEVRSLTVKASVIPTLFRPAPNAKFVIGTQGRPDEARVTFDWSAASFPQRRGERAVIRVERVGREVGTSRRQERQARPPFALGFREPGTYRWQVRGSPAADKGEASRGRWSPSRSFTVSAEPLPKAPRQNFPAVDATLTLDGNNPTIRFGWEETPVAHAGYRVQVSRDAEFREVLSDQRSRQQEVGWQPQDYGRHYWRLAVLDRFGRKTSFADAQPFDVHPPAPSLLDPSARQQISADSLEEQIFRWAPVWRIDKYRIEFALDRSFREIRFDQKIGGTSFSAPDLAPAHYFWRVAALPGAGVQPAYSGVHELVVKRTVEIEAPTLKLQYEIQIQR